MTYNGKPVALTFKKAVEFISMVDNHDELNEAFALVDFAFQHEKITWKEHEQLWSILNMMTESFMD